MTTSQPYVTSPAIGWGFDCTGNVISASTALQSTHPTAIWPYTTGIGGVDWPASIIELFAVRGTRVYRVNQGAGDLAGNPWHGDEFDYEANAWGLPGILGIIGERRSREWATRIYCTWANYGQIKQAAAERGMGRSLWFRIADWNLSAHLAELELHADVYAGQYASPTSNSGEIIPGTSLTLNQVDADLNVVLGVTPGWQG